MEPDKQAEEEFQALVTELGIEDLSREDQEEVIAELHELAVERALTRIHEQLPEDQRDTFAEMVSEAEEEELISFAGQFIEDVENLIEETTNEVLDEFVQLSIDEEDGEIEEEEPKV